MAELLRVELAADRTLCVFAVVRVLNQRGAWLWLLVEIRALAMVSTVSLVSTVTVDVEGRACKGAGGRKSVRLHAQTTHLRRRLLLLFEHRVGLVLHLDWAQAHAALLGLGLRRTFKVGRRVDSDLRQNNHTYARTLVSRMFLACVRLLVAQLVRNTPLREALCIGVLLGRLRCVK